MEPVQQPYRFQLRNEHLYYLSWLTPFMEVVDVIDEIGRGGQGAVYEAKFKPKHQIGEPLNAALKVIIIRGYTTEQDKICALRNAHREIDITNRITMSQPPLPNCVQFYRTNIHEHAGDKIDFKAFIAMERAEFDLSRFKDKPIQMRLELCLDACLGLNALHKLNIAHRDVKPSNYLVFRKNQVYVVKLSDFGCARLYNDETTQQEITATGAIGSGNYRPPEVIFPAYQGKDFRCQDIWSFCLTLLEILFGFPVESGAFFRLLSEVNSKKRDLTLQDINNIMEGRLKQFEGGEVLLGLILEGLRYQVKDRVPNLDRLQAFLEQCRGFQKKFCRFSNSKYRLELQLLSEAPYISDVLEDVVYEEPGKGIVILKGLYKRGLVQEKMLLKMMKVPMSSPVAKTKLRLMTANTYYISELYSNKLLRVYEMPRKFEWNGSLFAFVVMEHGEFTLSELYTGFEMESRLGLCFHILDSLMYLQNKRFAVRNLQLGSILLVKRGLCFHPKIMNFDAGKQECDPHNELSILREDLAAFLLLILQLISADQSAVRAMYLNELPQADRDTILMAFDKSSTRQEINRLATCILMSLNSNRPTQAIMADLYDRLQPFANALPSTFEGTLLSKLLKQEPHLVGKLIQADMLSDREFRVLYAFKEKEVWARLLICDLKSMNNEQRAIVNRQIEMIEHMQRGYKGFLKYYEGKSKSQSGYAYLITEDYFMRCSDVDSLRRQLLVSPNQIIADFKNIITGLSALHSLGIAHNDVVPSNIYLIGKDNTTSLKLGGFGRCIWNNQDQPRINRETEYNFRPMEFYTQRHYDVRLRFASDVWMIGCCVIAFLSGIDAICPIRDLLQEAQSKGYVYPQNAYCENMQEHSSEDIRATKFRKRLLLMNAHQRATPTCLNSFLNDFYSASTQTSEVRPSGLNVMSLSKTYEYKFGMAVNIEKYCRFLEYLTMGQTFNFLNFMRLVVATAQQNKTMCHETECINVGLSSYRVVVSSWLYILSFLESRLLLDCQEAITRSGEFGRQSSFMMDNRYRQEKFTARAAARQTANHGYLEKRDPNIVRVLEQLNLTPEQLWQKVFRPKILFVLDLIRDYVLFTFETFTVDDIEIIKGVIIGYEIARYADSPESFTELIVYTALKGKTLEELLELLMWQISR